MAVPKVVEKHRGMWLDRLRFGEPSAIGAVQVVAFVLIMLMPPRGRKSNTGSSASFR